MRVGLILVVGFAAMGVSGAAGSPRGADAAGDRLGERIEAAIKADGPFFTAAERGVIERKCGYAAGSFDGYEANMQDGVFICRGGKRVNDPEMRALLAAAEPRIERRVEAVMASPEVEGAIRAVAAEAERAALAAIDHAGIARQAAREGEAAARRARLEARRLNRR